MIHGRSDRNFGSTSRHCVMNRCLAVVCFLGLFVQWQRAEVSACYRPSRLTAPKGTLMSGVNLSAFQKPTVCVWEIEVAAGLRIELDVRVFEIETACCSCAEDFVEFRDGLSVTSPLIGRYCAKNQPERIYSSGNRLRVEFLSSAKRNANMSSVNKFRAEYQAICGGILRGRTGEVASPGYPNFSKGRCLFTIVVPFGWVRIRFVSFEVGTRDKHVPSERCDKDFVLIKEMSLVEYKDGFRQYSLCGQLKSQYFYSTRGRELSLLYKSSTGSRFSAKFEAITNGTTQCGGLLREVAGYIYSFGFPREYPRNTQCTWKIEVPHSFIKLKFLIFNFSELTDKCTHGRVDVFDGWTESAVKIRTDCGLIKAPLRILSRTNRLLIRSRSSNNSKTGTFLLSYKVVERGLCRSSEFSCVSRECISSSMVCDGRNDCSDGGDELNCPTQKKNKTLYALWVLVIFIGIVLMGFWLWRTWRKAVRHSITIQREDHPPCLHQEDGEHEVDNQSGAPPSYNEAVRQCRGNLPTYEEAVGDEQEAGIILLERNSVRFFNGCPNRYHRSGLPSWYSSRGMQVRQDEQTVHPTNV